jgi:hypothetical protein
MNGRTAAICLVVVCAILAGLLLESAISPVVAGGGFALALAVLGIVSGGFRKA